MFVSSFIRRHIFTLARYFLAARCAIRGTREEYAEIARPYDLHVLEGAQAGWLNIVHVHADPTQEGDEIYFEDFTDYPVAVMSWSDRITGP